MKYSDENRGALFKNKDKETDKHPDYKGKINVNGKDFYVSAWIKTSKGGDKFMSLAVREPMHGHQATKPQPKEDILGIKDDLPW
jgi:uncharacterized protein (DUF736 family)